MMLHCCVSDVRVQSGTEAGLELLGWHWAAGWSKSSISPKKVKLPGWVCEPGASCVCCCLRLCVSVCTRVCVRCPCFAGLGTVLDIQTNLRVKGSRLDDHN